MDYREEQAGEIEALTSIYEGEIQVLAESPHYVFTLPVKTEGYELDNDDDDGEEGLYVLLKFSYTEKYPEEAAVLEIEESDEAGEDGIVEELLEHLGQQMEENLGMVMVFTVVSAAMEWLGSKWEAVKEAREDREREKKDRIEAEERKKLEGTKVTVESFMTWAKGFVEEREAAKAKVSAEAAARLKGKLTGRQLFIKDASLIDSDVQFREAAGETVSVDESLFEDLDDLDLDDEEDEEEDPDWRP